MTKCIDPQELHEGDLMAFSEGTADEAVAEHVARCPYCASQVQAYRRMNQALSAGLYRRSCPAPERLTLYQMNLLPPKEKLLMSRHVRSCKHCQLDLETLAGKGEGASILERVRRSIDVVEAALTPLPRRASGLRGTAPALLRYESAEITIDLSVQPGHTRGERTLIGRVIDKEESPHRTTGEEVWLVTSEEGWVTPIDADGTFTFENVLPGTYVLAVNQGGNVVVAKDITMT